MLPGRRFEPVRHIDFAGLVVVVLRLERIPLVESWFLRHAFAARVVSEIGREIDRHGDLLRLCGFEVRAYEHDAGLTVRADIARRVKSDRRLSAGRVHEREAAGLFAGPLPFQWQGDLQLLAARLLCDHLSALERVLRDLYGHDEIGELRVLVRTQAEVQAKLAFTRLADHGVVLHLRSGSSDRRGICEARFRLSLFEFPPETEILPFRPPAYEGELKVVVASVQYADRVAAFRERDHGLSFGEGLGEGGEKNQQ